MTSYIKRHWIEGGFREHRYRMRYVKTHRGMTVPGRLCVTSGTNDRLIRKTPAFESYELIDSKYLPLLVYNFGGEGRSIEKVTPLHYVIANHSLNMKEGVKA